MPTKKTNRQFIVSLNLPRPAPALVRYAVGIVNRMTGNASFPTPVPSLAAVMAAIDALDVAETATLARTKGAATLRDEKKAELVTLLKQLRGYIQTVADANVDNASSIIESAGVAVKRTAVRKPRVFEARPGPVSGSVELVATLAARRAAYEWQYSTDGGKTWVLAPATLQAKTVVTGLTPGQAVQFRYRGVTRTGEGDWSQDVSLIVK